MRNIIFAALLLGFFAAPLSAQSRGPLDFSFGPQIGMYIPVQDQADDLSTAVTVGALVRTDVTDKFGIVASFWWAPSEADVASISAQDEDIDLFQYDLGMEIRPFPGRDGEWFAQPFLGLGAGGRSYSFRDLDEDSETDFAGYASLGAEVDLSPLALRVEGRGYLTEYNGLTGEHSDSEGRGEFTFSAALMYRF